MTPSTNAAAFSSPCAESVPSGGPGQSPGSAQPTDLQRLDLAIAQLEQVERMLWMGDAAGASSELANVQREFKRLRGLQRTLPTRVHNAVLATREYLCTHPAKSEFEQRLAKARMVLDLSIVRVEDLQHLNLDQAQLFAASIAQLLELQRHGGAA